MLLLIFVGLLTLSCIAQIKEYNLEITNISLPNVIRKLYTVKIVKGIFNMTIILIN